MRHGYPAPVRATFFDHVENVRRAIPAGRIGHAWAYIEYLCIGSHSITDEAQRSDAFIEDRIHRLARRGCGTESHLYLMYGVDGPEEMKEEGHFVPAPIWHHTCRACGGRTAALPDRHRIDPRPPPTDVHFLRLPHRSEARRFEVEGHRYAALHVPKIHRG